MSLVLQGLPSPFFNPKKMALMRREKTGEKSPFHRPSNSRKTGAFVPSISPLISAPCATRSSPSEIDRGSSAADVLVFPCAQSRQHRTMAGNRLRQQTSEEVGGGLSGLPGGDTPRLGRRAWVSGRSAGSVHPGERLDRGGDRNVSGPRLNDRGKTPPAALGARSRVV